MIVVVPWLLACASPVVGPRRVDTVADLAGDQACHGDFTTNTAINLVRRDAVIDRFYRNGDRRTVHVPLDDVDALAYARIGDCTAIYLKTETDRVLFEDDLHEDLAPRVRRLSDESGKPVVGL